MDMILKVPIKEPFVVDVCFAATGTAKPDADERSVFLKPGGSDDGSFRPVIFGYF